MRKWPRSRFGLGLAHPQYLNLGDPVSRDWTARAEALCLAEFDRGRVGIASRLDTIFDQCFQFGWIAGDSGIDDDVHVANLAARRQGKFGLRITAH